MHCLVLYKSYVCYSFGKVTVLPFSVDWLTQLTALSTSNERSERSATGFLRVKFAHSGMNPISINSKIYLLLTHFVRSQGNFVFHRFGACAISKGLKYV